MKIKRWVAALLCVLLIGSLFPTRAFAADGIASGTGWNLDADGVLHITGDIDESGFNLTDEQKQQVKSAVAASDASISSGTFLFNGFENMTSADLSLLNTTGVTDMSYMFYGCRSLTSLNLSNFNTINVTTMAGMFSGCSSLTSLDLSGFRTGSVTYMIGMFTNCSSLTSLDLSKFETGNVTQMAFMFSDCSSLTSIDLSKFETGNVTSMAAMFINCSGLTSLDLSSFDTRSVNNMGGMFEGCSSLTSLDVSGLKTGSLTNAEEMFCGCSALTSLDVSGFDTSTVSNMQKMFSGCNSLTALGITPDILDKNADGIIAIRSPWQKQGSTDTYSTADELKAVTDTVTLLAMYAVNVQNDGNGTASANPAAAVKGDTVTLTATPNNGYHFKEWQSSDVTVINNTFTMPEKNVTVKAIFEADAPTTYTVTINNDGHGTASADNASAAEGKAITLTAAPDAGYRFKEWQSTDVTVTDNKFTMPAKAVTVTAVFEAIPTYTVTFNMNGHGTQVTEQTVEEGCKATKPSADPSENGWSFGGWYTDMACNEAFDFTSAITANTTIYAKWTQNPAPPAPVTITSIAINNADITPVSGEKAGDHLAFILPTGCHYTATMNGWWDVINSKIMANDDVFEAGGLYCASWNFVADEGYAFAEDTTVTINGSVDNVDTEHSYPDATGDAPLFIVSSKGALVEAAPQPPVPTKYTVSFNMNGHGTQVADQTVEDGSMATKPAVDPTASGWTFGGWYADATFSATFDFNTIVHTNLTVYAKWTENITPPDPTYTIIAGTGAEWTKGSKEGLLFTSDADFDKFDSVLVDGNAVAAENYTAVKGSTKITLLPSYLETLRVGSHTIRIVSNDGSASTSFRIKAAPQPTDPTGPKAEDNSHLLLWVLLLAACGAALTGIAIYCRKRRKMN